MGKGEENVSSGGSLPYIGCGENPVGVDGRSKVRTSASALGQPIIAMIARVGPGHVSPAFNELPESRFHLLRRQLLAALTTELTSHTMYCPVEMATLRYTDIWCDVDA